MADNVEETGHGPLTLALGFLCFLTASQSDSVFFFSFFLLLFFF